MNKRQLYIALLAAAAIVCLLFLKRTGNKESASYQHNEGTIFDFKGVDDGNYVLVETTIPESYNACDALAFTVSATHDTTSDDPKLQSLAGGDKFTGDAEAGILTTDVENKKGNTLPSTGGIGTTIFYVLGGLLVAFAAILLITKKRMDTRG